MLETYIRHTKSVLPKDCHLILCADILLPFVHCRIGPPHMRCLVQGIHKLALLQFLIWPDGRLRRYLTSQCWLSRIVGGRLFPLSLQSKSLEMCLTSCNLWAAHLCRLHIVYGHIESNRERLTALMSKDQQQCPCCRDPAPSCSAQPQLPGLK